MNSNLTPQEQQILDSFSGEKDSRIQAWEVVWNKLSSLPEYTEEMKLGNAPGIICALRIIDKLRKS